MKKIYCTPELSVIEIESSPILTGSDTVGIYGNADKDLEVLSAEMDYVVDDEEDDNANGSNSLW